MSVERSSYRQISSDMVGHGRLISSDIVRYRPILSDIVRDRLWSFDIDYCCLISIIVV